MAFRLIGRLRMHPTQRSVQPERSMNVWKVPLVEGETLKLPEVRTPLAGILASDGRW